MTGINGKWEGEGEGAGYFLVLIIHGFVEFGVTNLAEHFGKNLSCVAVGCLLVVCFLVFFSFRLYLSGWFKQGMDEMGQGKRARN